MRWTTAAPAPGPVPVPVPVPAPGPCLGLNLGLGLGLGLCLSVIKFSVNRNTQDISSLALIVTRLPCRLALRLCMVLMPIAHVCASFSWVALTCEPVFNASREYTFITDMTAPRKLGPKHQNKDTTDWKGLGSRPILRVIDPIHKGMSLL